MNNPIVFFIVALIVFSFTTKQTTNNGDENLKNAVWISDDTSTPASDSLFYTDQPAPIFRKEFNADENIPVITGNGYRFEQVIINMLINAKDAIEEKKKKGLESSNPFSDFLPRYVKRRITPWQPRLFWVWPAGIFSGGAKPPAGLRGSGGRHSG